MRWSWSLVVLLLAPLMASADPMALVRPDLLKAKPRFVFKLKKTPELAHGIDLDGERLRAAFAGRTITDVKVIASTPTESGGWHDAEVDADPQARDFQHGALLRFEKDLALHQGLSDTLRAQMTKIGAAYRAEVTTSDGRTTTVHLQRNGNNVLPSATK